MEKSLVNLLKLFYCEKLLENLIKNGKNLCRKKTWHVTIFSIQFFLDPAKMCVNEGQEKLPEGRYTYVGLDIDTTGRRLIDEIVQIAAYCPNDSFSQYIMPLMNLNPAARQRHQVRVITVGFFRMLKSMQTYKVREPKKKSKNFVSEHNLNFQSTLSFLWAIQKSQKKYFIAYLNMWFRHF